MVLVVPFDSVMVICPLFPLQALPTLMDDTVQIAAPVTDKELSVVEQPFASVTVRL